MSETITQPFGKLRSFFWPIHRFELKKIIPMQMIVFLVLFNYTLLRDGKDSLIVPFCGAETIPFLKVWGVLPFAVLFMVVYSKLSNTLSKEKLFYTAIIPFAIFFGLFALVLYPNREILEPTAFAGWMKGVLPDSLGGLAGVVQNWPFALFYIMAELWGSVALSLLFWGFANDITRVKEAPRFYPVFNLVGNVALQVSGVTIVLSTLLMKALPKEQGWQYALNIQMGLVVAASLLIMVIYRWMQKNVLTDSRFYNPDEVKKKKVKAKMGLFESFGYLAKSKYILSLAAIVLCYGVAINLVEVTWKGQLRLQYPDALDYNRFMGYFSFTVGTFTIAMVFIGSWVLRRFGWSSAAMFTPVALGLTAFPFFMFVLLKPRFGVDASILGLTPLLMAVLFGAAQNIISKGSKYSLFDPTKEMAYIPLDDEQKVKGKAAIDVVGARLGKSGGALIQQVLIAVFTFGAIVPYVAIILGGTLLAWAIAARSLGRQFASLTQQRDEERAADEEAAALEPVAG
jgi:ATP:ADP antiporter, AAA family